MESAYKDYNKIMARIGPFILIFLGYLCFLARFAEI